MKLQLFAEGETPTAESIVVAGQEVVKTPVQTDIEKMEGAIKALKESGEDLFKDQIAALENKIAEEKAKAEAALKEAEETVQEVEQSFVEKYGNKIVQGLQIVLLGYIVYKLF